MVGTHKHHLKPRHLGGTNDPSNLLEVTVEEHALIHEARWYAYHQWEDWLAWKGLEGSIGKEEIIYLKNSLAHNGVSNPHTKKWNKNIGKALKGKRKTLQHIENMSKSLKGRKTWNKGLTKDDPRVAKYAAGISANTQGRTPWNKGKKVGPHSVESNIKRSLTQKGKPKPRRSI